MPKWPKLSETLTHPRAPGACQSCGAKHDNICVWVECDDNDRPTTTIVLLCDPCGKRIIEPHPRLYSRDTSNKPRPGAMLHLCWNCVFRDGLNCTHPDLKSNGGAGLMINVAPPARGFWDGRGKDGRRTGGMFEHWQPARSCAGRKI